MDISRFFPFWNPNAFLVNRYLWFLVFLLVYPLIMERYGGLPVGSPPWRLELPLLLYIYFYLNRILRLSRFQALMAATPPLLAYAFTEAFYIMFGRLPRLAEVAEIPELVHVTNFNALVLFGLAVGLPALGFLALLNFRRYRGMVLGAAPLAMLILCVEFSPDLFLSAFEKTQMKIVTYSEVDNAVNNGRYSMMLYNEARRRNFRKKIAGWWGGKSFAAKFDKLKETVRRGRTKRNVHLVVLESFLDPELFRKAQYSRKPAHPDYEKLFRNKMGFSISPVFCGGTAQAEFELLCGVPALRELSGVEFDVFTSAKTLCLPNVLAQGGYRTFATNSYKPEFFNSTNAYAGMGFEKSYYPREYAPGRDTYLTTGDTAGEKYMFDGELFSQNLEFVAKHLQESPDQPLFNYVIGIYGHIPLALNTDKRPKLVQIKSEIKADELEMTANQYYYRTEAIADYVRGLLAVDPESLLILVSDHLPTLDFGPITYKELQYLDGSADSVYLNRILIVENAKPVGYGTIRHFNVPQIILNYVTEGAYCEENECAFSSPPKPLDREYYREAYMAIMAHAMEMESPAPGESSLIRVGMENPVKKAEGQPVVRH